MNAWISVPTSYGEAEATMDASDYIPLVNTAILLIIFFYQKNKNKVLLDRITQQEKVINETKGIVSQQSTAIDSQSKVVDSAIKYSESFSPEKLEAIIRREIEVERQEEIRDVHKNAGDALNLADSLLNGMVVPYLQLLGTILTKMPAEESNQLVEDMEDGQAKNMLNKVLQETRNALADYIQQRKQAIPFPSDD